MKLNKTIIISDILSILIAFVLFIWTFMEMKCVAIVNDRIINSVFIKDFNPIQTISLGRNLCQEKDMFSLINYTFPGIQKFCYNTYTRKIETDCTEGKTNISNIEEIQDKNFTIWRNKIMCTKYFEYNNSTYKFIQYDEEADCGSDYKKCGTLNENQNINLYKILCVKNNIECPLNFIEITNDKTPYESSTDYDIKSFENGYYLITSNKKTSNGIITKIKIAEGEYPCYERDRYSNTTSQFPKINNLEYFNCSSNSNNKSTEESELRLLDEKEDNDLIKQGYDIRYKKFDTRIKRDVLIENDFDYSYSRLPNLTNWKQDMYTSNFTLFYLNSFIIKEECTDFESLEKSIIKLKNVQGSRVLFALFHILIYVILFSILGLIKVILAWRHSLLFGIKVGLSFIIFGINFGLIYSSEIYIEDLKKFENLGSCLDAVSQALLYNHDIEFILKELSNFYYWEKIVWYIYVFFNFIEACRLVHKIYIRIKNTYRRNIANREIGSDNLKKIFEKVRNQIEKKKEN